MALSGWKRAALVLFLLYSAAHLVYSIQHYNPVTAPAVSGDFLRTYREASELKSQWERTRGLSITQNDHLYHPLTYYVALWPLVGLGEKRVCLLLFLLQFILFPWAIVLLVRSVARESVTWVEYALSFALAVNFHPFLETLAQHKTEGVEFFLICAAVYALGRGREVGCGALVCAAAGLKYLPAVLVLFFLIKRQTRVLLGFFGAALILLVLLAAVFGVPAIQPLLAHHVFRLLFSGEVQSNRQESYIEFQSVSGAVKRWFSAVEPGQTFSNLLEAGSGRVVHPAAARFLSFLLQALLTVPFVWLTGSPWHVRREERRWPLYLLELSLGLTMLVVLIQAIRLHYAILLLPAYILTGLVLYRHRSEVPLRGKLLFGLAYLLGGIVIPAGLLRFLPASLVWGRLHFQVYLWTSGPVIGYLLLGVAILLCHKRLRTV